MPDTARLVEVRARREGSGYLITDRLVLTAWHVIRREDGGTPAVRVRVEGRIGAGQAPAGAEEPAEVLWPKEDPGEDLDFALLLLATPLPCAPLSWAPLGDSGRLEVTAIGYPDASIDRARQVRDTRELSGWTRLGDRVRERREGRGTFEIRIPDEDQPAGPAAAAWPAMSGAAVFAADALVGVIRLASTQQSRGVLDALPVDRLLARADVQEALRRAGCALPARLPPRGPAEAQRLTYRWPQAWDFEAYMEEKRGDSFEGREWVFGRIEAWRRGGESRALLIRADFGVGKSALLSEYVRRHRGEAVIAWHFCQHDTQATLRAGTFVRSLATQLADALPAYRDLIEGSLDLQKALDEVAADPASALEAAVLAPLSRIDAPAEPALLVVDALDEALELEASAGTRRITIVDLLARKAGRFPAWLRILASSRPVPAVLTPLAAAFAPSQIDAESAGNHEDLRRFVLARLPALAGALAAAGLAQEAFAQLLLAHSGGKFLFVVHALRDVAAGSLSPEQLAALPPGMDAFYLDFFERRFGARAEAYPQVAPLLSVMCAAREPLSRAEVAAILGISPRAVQSAQGWLPDFLRLRSERLNFDHASLKEWLTEEDAGGMPRAGLFAVDMEEAQSRLTQWARACVAAGTAQESPYLLRNLAAHLPGAAERRTVYAQLLLGRFGWSWARLEMAGVPGLLADSQHLSGHPEQSLFQDLVRNSELTLRRSTGQWCAQVLGRLGTAAATRIGLPALAASAQEWLSGGGMAQDILVPATRSLRWVSGQDLVLEGEAPLLVLPDGRIVSGGRGGGVRVWDPARQAEPIVFEGHTKPVEALVALPGGRIASAGRDRRVRVWDLRQLASPLVLKGHTDTVTALAVLADGRLVSGSEDGTVRVWDLSGPGGALVLAGHAESVFAVAVLPDGRIVSGADDATVRVWDLARPQEPRVLEGHESRVVALLALPDGRIVSSSWDATVRVWDSTGAREPQVLRGHTGAVGPLARLSDGRIVSAADDGSLRLWDLSGERAPQVLDGHAGYVWALAVLPDDRVVSGSWDRTVRVWSTRQSPPAPPVVLQGHSDKLRGLALLPDGRIVSCADDGTVRVWNPARQADTQAARVEPAAVEALLALPGGRVAWGGPDGTVQITVAREETAPRVLAGHLGEIRALALLPDGRLVSAARDRTVRVWDLSTGQEGLLLKGHKGVVEALAVLPDGRLVSAGWDRSLRVWDLAHPEEPLILKGHTERVRALAVLPDGRIVSGSADHTVRVWDPQERREPLVLEGHTGRVRALAVLPDGRIASASRDRSVQVWDLARPQEPLVLTHPGRLRALAPLPDGRLASCDEDGAVYLWDLRSPEEPRVLSGHAGEVHALAVLPDGRLASAGDDGTVRVWRESAGLTPGAPVPLVQSFLADAPVLSLAVVPPGLVAGCKDGTVHVLRGGG